MKKPSRFAWPGSEQTSTLGLSALVLPSLLIVALVWLPFGPALIGAIEEWGMLGMFNAHGTFFVVHADGPVAIHALRALMPSSFATAYELAPNSFNGWHLLQSTSLLVKGAASTYLIWKATGSRFLAVVMGALVLVYPADTMQLSFRSVHINESIALALLASALFMATFGFTRRSVAAVVSAIAATVFFVACAIYEAALTLFLLPLLLLYVRHGLRNGLSLLRSSAGSVVVWCVGACAYVGFAWWASRRVASYQQSLANGEGGLVGILVQALPKLFSIGALRSMLGGWVDALRMLSTEFSTYAYLGVAALAIGLLIWMVLRKSGHSTAPQPSMISAGQIVRLAIVGFVLMLMGYAPFLLSQAHLTISQRTFIWATPGAVMVWLALIAWLSKSSVRVAGGAALTLIVVGLAAQLFQFHHYVTIAERQRALLRAIVENFDGRLGKKTLVVLDGTNQLGHTWMLLQGLLPDALTYLYGHPVGPVEVCHEPSGEWHAADTLGRKGSCVEGPAGDWTFRYPSPVATTGFTPPPVPAPRTVSASDALVLRIAADGSVTPDPALDAYRANLGTGRETIALRYRGVLKGDPWPLRISMFKDEKVSDHYRWDFGDYWSLEIPTRGSGWREAEWTVERFHHKAAAWKTGEVADLYFEFAPTAGAYRLHGSFDMFAPGVIKEQMKIRINGHDVGLRWNSATDVQADFPAALLKRGTNALQVELPVDLGYFGLSTRLDWIEIAKSR